MTIEGAPFPFFGGKQGLARQIVSLLPPHEVYCEPYAGSCAVLWRKPPSPLEVINDMDGELVHFYKVLRDPWLAAALQFSLTLTPHARKEWRESVAAVRAMRAEAREGREARVAVAGGTAAATQAQASGRIYAPDVTPVANLAACSMMGGDVPRVDTDQDPPVEAPLVAEVDLADLANMANTPMTVEGAAAVERARRWYVAVTQSFSKTSTGAAGWAFCRQPNGHVARKWRNWVEELPPFTLRLARVQIEEMDAIELISHYDAPNVVFYCLAPDTQVRTLDERFIPVEQVRTGDVLAPGRTVQRVWSRHHHGDLLGLRVQGMPDVVRVTPEHRFIRIPKRTHARQDKRTSAALWEQREFVPARDLEVGDYLLAPLGGQETQVPWEWDNSPRRWGRRKPNATLTPCPELYRFLGYYAAEGHIQRKGGYPIGVILSFCEDEADTWILDAVSCCEKAFGVKAETRPGPPTTARVTQVCVWSSTVAQFVERYVNGVARTKHLHAELLAAPCAGQAELLMGWLRGDGGFEIATRNRCKLVGTTSSEQLARDMFLLAIRCGMRPSFKQRTGAFDVYFASEDARMLGWEPPTRRFRSSRRIINGHMLVRIRAISTEPYNGLVYDIDVDGDDLFSVPYVLTHNCDPPYLPLTRTDPARHGYAHEMSCEDHVRLLEVVTRLRGHALLSGYHSPLYDEALAGWRCVEFATYASSATPQRSKRPRRTECLWLSPGAMVQPSLF